jgi:hypothetical protein
VHGGSRKVKCRTDSRIMTPSVNGEGQRMDLVVSRRMTVGPGTDSHGVVEVEVSLGTLDRSRRGLRLAHG